MLSKHQIEQSNTKIFGVNPTPPTHPHHAACGDTSAGPSTHLQITSKIRRALHHTHDIVALGEEGKPVIQHLLLALRQILPLGRDVLRFGAGLCEGARCVVAGERCAPPSVWERTGGKSCVRTLVRTAWLVRLIACDVKHLALDRNVAEPAVQSYKHLLVDIRGTSKRPHLCIARGILWRWGRSWAG
jgi:hypothetical protein